jgi:hypothetical protein
MIYETKDFTSLELSTTINQQNTPSKICIHSNPEKKKKKKKKNNYSSEILFPGAYRL